MFIILHIQHTPESEPDLNSSLTQFRLISTHIQLALLGNKPHHTLPFEHHSTHLRIECNMGTKSTN